MGAVNVMIPAAEIFTALDRGLVDGAAWPGLGAIDIGIERQIAYRIDPPIWQFDNVLLVSGRRWRAMSGDQRSALRRVVEDWEPVAYARFDALAANERQAVENAGVMPFALTGGDADRYRVHAREIQWRQIADRSPAQYHAIRQAFETPSCHID
jgi:TRAP-type C4-dicarboxylate transport system substrate-binding protein